MPVIYLVPRRRHDLLRRRQGDGPHRRRILRQRHQRHARRRGRLATMSACPSRKPSTSNTGCSRRRSSSACRSRRASPGASPWSPAAPAASARRSRRLLAEGACVVLADIDAAALDETVASFAQRYRQGRRSAAASWCDVTDEEAVIDAFDDGGMALRRHRHRRQQCRHRARPRRSRTRRWSCGTSNIVDPATGYFLVGARRLPPDEAPGSRRLDGLHRLEERASRPRPAPRAYCTAKAAEIHLARCMALEGAPIGIRVNVVNPDAVMRGSKIWQGDWRQQRAAIEQDHARTISRSIIASARCCSVGLPRGHRRGGLFLRLRPFGEVDRQFPQCRCRQRGKPSRDDTCQGMRACSYRASRRIVIADRELQAPEAALGRGLAALGRKLARRGIESRRSSSSDGLRGRGADLGRRHRRHPLCPLSGAGRTAQHPRQARGLRRHPATHPRDAECLARISPGTRSATMPHSAGGGWNGLGFDAVNSNTFQDQTGQKHSPTSSARSPNRQGDARRRPSSTISNASRSAGNSVRAP